MANYPGSLDTLTNPISTNTQDSPSHSGQHATANDILEALETKLGTGASTPTTAGHVLTVTGAGATAYQAGGVGVGLRTAALGGSLYFTGRYYDGQNISTGTTNAALTLDFLYFTPVYIPLAVTADRIAINNTTNPASSAIRLGIYAAGTNGRPDTLLLDAGTVDTSTGTGAKEITISQALAADTLYWCAAVANVGVQIAHRSAGSPAHGAPSAITPVASILRAAFTYATLPADTSGLTLAIVEAASTPRIMLRIA